MARASSDVEPSRTSELLRTARAALAAYGIPPDAHVEPIRLTNNAVFEVRHDARLVLRVHRPRFRTPAHTRSELGFLQVLAERLEGTRANVPRPIPACNGELVVEVSGPVAGLRANESRHCDLLTWVDGRVLRPERGLGLRAVHDLGEVLARLHNAAEAFVPPRGFELPRWDADAMFTAASPFRPGRLDGVLSAAERRLVEDVEARTRAVFESLASEPSAFGIIHADFILGNCHFVRRAHGWEVGVLDFDDLGWGYFLYDLCPLLGNLADFPSYRVRSGAFLAGYRTVRPLARRLEVHLPILMAARHVVACAWVVGIQGTNPAAPPVAKHVAIRIEQIRHCLSIRP